MPNPDAFCKGDSGGSLVLVENGKYQMIGTVTSKLATHPSELCDAFFPGIYVRIDHPEILNFIKSKAFDSSEDITETATENNEGTY